jgi:hypothetical protein
VVAHINRFDPQTSGINLDVIELSDEQRAAITAIVERFLDDETTQVD